MSAILLILRPAAFNARTADSRPGRLADAASSRALVGGQVDDLGFAERPDGGFERLQSIHVRKTGALFRVACWGGGRLAGGSEGDCARLDAFAREFGLAFQLADDLADADPDECSALRLLSPRELRARAGGHLQGALAALEHFGESAGALRSLAERLAGRLA